MRSAGANLTSQVGDISMRTASNLGDIQMAIARMRAAGIQEGSQVWQNVMKQFAAMATAIPQEQRRQRMEQLAIEDQAMQRAREARREQRQEQLLPLETEQRTQAIKIQGLNLKQAERASEVQKLYDDLVIKHTTIDQKTGQLKQNVEAIQDGLIQARYADEAFKVQQQATITRKNNELLDRQARNEKRKLFESTTPSGLALLKAVEDKEPKESQQAAYEAYRGDLLRIKDSMDDPEQSAGYENFINQIFPVEWTPDLYPTAKGFVAKHLTETAAMNMYKGGAKPSFSDQAKLDAALEKKRESGDPTPLTMQETAAAIAPKNLGATPADIEIYEELKKQGYKGTLEDSMGIKARAYGATRGRQVIDPSTGELGEWYPLQGRLEKAPPGNITPTFAGKIAEAKSSFAAADSMLDTIEEAAKKVVTAKGWTGVPSQYVGATLGAITRANPDAAVYLATRDAFASMLTRAAGEKGVLTTQDVQRIINALPSTGDTVEIANRKLEQLRSLYTSIRDASIKAYGGGVQTAPAGGQQGSGLKIHPDGTIEFPPPGGK